MGIERLSVILPAYNERGNLAPLLCELASVASSLPCLTEVIVVDDGSTDGTPLEVEQTAAEVMPPLEEVKLVCLKGNYGQTVAITVGILHATGDVIVLMDADRQNDPADIPKFLAKLSEGFDVVSGWRKDRKDPLTKVLPSKIANALIAWATGVWVHDLGCSLRAYRSWVLQSLAREGFQHRYLPIYCAAKGASIAEVVVNHRPRTVGKSKYGLERVFTVLKDLPLLVFLARYRQNPFSGFANLASANLLVAILCGVTAWLTTSIVPMLVMVAVLGISLLLGLGCASELLLGVTEHRANAICQSVAEVKIFASRLKS